jgi:hypothetical protein
MSRKILKDSHFEMLLNVLPEHAFQVFLRNKSHPFLQNLSAGIQQVEFGLVAEAERALKVAGEWIVRVEVGEFDPAKVFRFKPMNHGRHGTAGASSEAEKLDKLQPA